MAEMAFGGLRWAIGRCKKNYDLYYSVESEGES